MAKPSQDPFYLVKDDIQGSVRHFQLFQGSAGVHLVSSWILGGPAELKCARRCVQMEKAQAQFMRWQQLSKGNAERKRLEGEIDDECRSIAWQARRGLCRRQQPLCVRCAPLDSGSASGDAGG